MTLVPPGKMGPRPTNLVGLVPILNIPRQESVPEVEANIEMLTGKETSLSGRHEDIKVEQRGCQVSACWTPVTYHVDNKTTFYQVRIVKIYLIALINVVTV